ncbi:Uncharacterized protein PRO82_001870 [Candidatus Protochlamydia amoebophila]|nr:Uncharacterized protein [Candidatus Protochlamydia amoebophila]
MKLRSLFFSLLFISLSILFLFFLVRAWMQKDIFEEDQNLVWVGAIIDNQDQLIPPFLQTIEKLYYDKAKMHLQIDYYNQNKHVRKIVMEWVEKNKKFYQSLVFVDHPLSIDEKKHFIEKNKVLANIKNGYLANCQQQSCNYCLILSSDMLIAPHTLKYLIKKDKPIISPLLRPFPQAHDPYRNFFCDVTEEGYYKHHEDYLAIANRQKLGTFQVPCVHGVYLIQAPFLSQLSFTEGFKNYEFLAFSTYARKKNMGQFICNEREFGFLMHLSDDATLDQQKNFKLVNAEKEMTPAIFHSILSPYFTNDFYLSEIAKDFSLDQYQIYRVYNRDLFLLDENNDRIKNHTIKQGANWEEHFYSQFQKYVKPDTIAIDVGAHIGTHTLALSKLVGEKGKVYAFEPQAKIFCELAINMYLNNCHQVELFHKALGVKEDWKAMRILKEEDEMVSSPFYLDNKNKVQIVELDNFHLHNISLIKINVEGFEMEILAGGWETIQRNKPVMIIKISNNEQKQNKIQTIENFGYASSNLSGNDYLFIPLAQLGLLEESN